MHSHTDHSGNSFCRPYHVWDDFLLLLLLLLLLLDLRRALRHVHPLLLRLLRLRRALGHACLLLRLLPRLRWASRHVHLLRRGQVRAQPGALAWWVTASNLPAVQLLGAAQVQVLWRSWCSWLGRSSVPGPAPPHEDWSTKMHSMQYVPVKMVVHAACPGAHLNMRRHMTNAAQWPEPVMI